MKPKKLNERQLVNLLVKALKKNSPGIYIHVDRDSGSTRHTSSGWDFLAVWEGKTVFCECKVKGGKLTDWQKLTRVEVQKAKGRYKILKLGVVGSEWVAWSNTEIHGVSFDSVNGEWLTH